MKNIVLLAKQSRFDKRRLDIVNKILADENNQIIFLLVNPNTDKTIYEQMPRVKTVMTSLEFEHQEGVNALNWDEILRYKGQQLHVENFFARFYNDYQIDKYYYYCALNFWIDFFNNNKIDFVISTLIKHGSPWEVCAAIADMRGVPCYYIEPLGYNDTYFFSNNGSPHISYVGKVKSFEDFMYCSIDKTKLAPRKLKKPWFRKILYSIGGNLLEDFGLRLLAWNWRSMSLSRLRCKITWSDKFLGYISLRKTERYLGLVSNKYKNKTGEKYIFYALHFEPEATIQVRNVLESQLVAIKMLSEALPEDCKLFVKEHPAQFDVNTDEGYAYLTETPRFKNKAFYKKILSFRNVVIIDNKVSSRLLAKNAMAVASICGFVLWESVALQKPVILFSELNPLAYVRDAFLVRSYDDCQRAVAGISDGFVPHYGDVDKVLQKYIFKGDDMAENISILLEQECMNNTKRATNKNTTHLPPPENKY